MTLHNNVTRPSEVEKRQQVVQQIFGKIGKNIWIGTGVIILPGVTIGSGSVNGAGAVVTKDIPSNVVAVGNPCRVLREITDYDKEYYRKNMRFDDIEW